MLNADQNFCLLQEIEANRTFLLMAYQQNPKLLAGAEARIQQIVGRVAPPRRDNHPSSVLSPQSSERGISLIELILFIVIMGVALGGILAVMNRVTNRSVDTLLRKQALAVAESLLEEVELMPFTYCDPDDPTAASAASPILGAGSCSIRVEGLGLDTVFVPQPADETRYSNTSPFDNVNDYNGCQLNAAANAGCDPAGNGDITDINNNPIIALGGYNARIDIVGAAIPAIGGALPIAETESLRITVTVTGPDNESVVLDGYRTRYSPNSVP